MYLIDGNNVMGQRIGWHRDKPGAQRRLITELGKLRQQQRVGVTVVFDGRPPDGMTDPATVDGVTVYFAHPGSDADERIIELAGMELAGMELAGTELAGDATTRGEILAVTSDRRLRTRLEDLGIETLRSGQFRKLLEAP